MVGAVRTPFTDLVGCRHPLQQAAMGGVAVPELAGAVAKAGALGMLCQLDVAPAADRMTRALELAAGGAVGMGFFGHWLDGDLEAFELAAARLRLVEVFWTEPSPAVVARARGAGPALVAWQVGSVVSAVAAQDAGCDLVVLQGVEAGGHVRGTVPRAELAATAHLEIPVVVAGGIASAGAVAEAIAAGASGVRVGTRFVATAESGAHPDYVQALLAARSADDTVLTTAFGGGWPDAPHRVLRSAVAAAQRSDRDVIAHEVHAGSRAPIERFSVQPPTRATDGDIAAMALYAGEAVGDVQQVGPAAAVVAELVSLL